MTKGIYARASAAERRARIVELSSQGLSIETIADMLSLNTRTVQRARAHAGIAQQPAKYGTEDEKLRAKIMLVDGASYEEVGRTLGRFAGTVANWHPGHQLTDKQIGEASAMSRKFRRLDKVKHLQKV